MTKETLVELPFTPLPWQKYVMDNLARFTVLVVGRQSGKSTLAQNVLVQKMLETQNGKFAFVSPELKQAKRNVWADMLGYLKPLIQQGRIQTNSQELTIYFPENNSWIYFLGTDNVDANRGLRLNYAVMDEVADMPQNAWDEVISPMLSTTEGGALFIGTPKGRNFFTNLYLFSLREENDEWMGMLLKTENTGNVSKKELDSQRRRLGAEKYEQEFECNFDAKIRGAYYGKEMGNAIRDKRICTVKWQRDLPVITSWDLGLDGIAVWFAQIINGDIHVIDFEMMIDKQLKEMLNVVNQKPYVYDYHIVPHDAARGSVVMKLSPMKQMKGLGWRLKRLKKTKSVSQDIEIVRSFISRCAFDSKQCEQDIKQGTVKIPVGLESLRQYRREFDEQTGTYREQPIRSIHNHAADSFRYLVLGLKSLEVTEQKNSLEVKVEGKYNPYKYDYNAREAYVDNKWNPFK